MAQMALMRAQTENIQADTENKKMDTTKKDEEQWGLGLDNAFKDAFQNYDENGEPTGQDVHKSVAGQQRVQEMVNTKIQGELMKQGIEVDKATINKMTQDILQRTQEIAIEGRAVSVSELLAKFNTDWKNIIGKEALETVSGVIKLLPLSRMLGGKGHNVIEGFRKKY